MKHIFLILRSPAGDELGRLPLTAVVVMAAGEPAPTGTCLPRRAQFETLMCDLYTVLQVNGLRSAQTPAAVEFAASLALLHEGDDEVTIPLIVEPLTLPHAQLDAGAAGTPEQGAMLRWDDLLLLTDTQEADHA